jgi:hypothetical protein
MNLILPRFVKDYVEDESDVPESVTIEFRFTTYDPTIKDDTKFIRDSVSIEIISNGDHGQCVDATYELDAPDQTETDAEFVVPADGTPAPSMTIEYT